MHTRLSNLDGALRREENEALPLSPPSAHSMRRRAGRWDARQGILEAASLRTPNEGCVKRASPRKVEPGKAWDCARRCICHAISEIPNSQALSPTHVSPFYQRAQSELLDPNRAAPRVTPCRQKTTCELARGGANC